MRAIIFWPDGEQEGDVDAAVADGNAVTLWGWLPDRAPPGIKRDCITLYGIPVATFQTMALEDSTAPAYGVLAREEIDVGGAWRVSPAGGSRATGPLLEAAP